MLSALPSTHHHLQMSQPSQSLSRNIDVPSSVSGEEDKLCAGCKLSVNSETGGVVVAFGNSLWHVDCFKCAKCECLAETSLLLLSDGSPVCAKCYSCKICDLPILDEAVMTGDESYHASCFVCRTCHNRIDELVFAKTSQGFYCMSCHNERVARSRRHAARQKQKEKDRQGPGLGSGSGSGKGAGSGGGSGSGRSRDGIRAVDEPSSPVPWASTPTRSGHATPPPPSSDDHRSSRGLLQPSPIVQMHASDSSTSGSAADPNASFADTSIISTNSAIDATFAHRTSLTTPSERQSISSATSVVSASLLPSTPTVARSKAELASELTSEQAHSEPRLLADDGHGLSRRATTSRPSLDIAPPPPYSVTLPENHASSNPSSARSSVSMAALQAASSQYSPTHSLANPHSPSQTMARSTSIDADSIRSFESGSSTALEYLRPSPRERVDTLPLSHISEESNRQIPVDFDKNGRRKSFDDGTRPLNSFLYPSSNLPPRGNEIGTSSLTIPNHGTSKRDKRGSINPGFQFDPAMLQQFQVPSQSSLQQPTSSNRTASASSSTSNVSQSQTNSSSPKSAGRASPGLPSPLRDYFTISARQSLDSNEVERPPSSTSTNATFYSASQSSQPPRGDSPSSGPRVAIPAVQELSSSTPPSQSGTGPSEVLAKPPQRSDSLASPDLSLSFSPVTKKPHGDEAAQPHRTNQERLAPSGAMPTLKQQRSFNERGAQLQPAFTGEYTGKADQGRLGSTSWRRSTGLTLPDVPRGIESGTDTEVDGEGDTDRSDEHISIGQGSYGHNIADSPPVPPPKEVTHDSEQGHDERMRHSETSAADFSPNAVENDINIDGEKESQESHPPSPLSPMERKTGYFVAPAIPPIRFSLSETDFSEILRHVNGSSLSQSIPSISEDVDPGVTVASPASTAAPEEKVAATATVSPPIDLAAAVTPTKATFSPDEVNGTTPKAITRTASKRVGKLPGPDFIALVEHKTTQVSDRPGSTSPTSPVRPELPQKSPRRMSKRGSRILEEQSLQRSPGDLHQPDSPVVVKDGLSRSDSNASKELNGTSRLKTQNFLSPPRTTTPRPSLARHDTADLVCRRLREAFKDASERHAEYLKLDIGFVEAILNAMDQRSEQYLEISSKLDGMKRASQQIMDGLTVAQEEYDSEVTGRREAEAEVKRLKIELSGQAARLTAMSGDERRQELQRQMSKELTANLSGLEHDLSKLKVERDMTLAEVEELSASKSSGGVASGTDVPAAKVSRSLTLRLDNIKKQYQKELIPLTQQREVLMREIMELKEARNIYLEETTVLNARNEELAQLNVHYARRVESPEPGTQKRALPHSVKPAPSSDTVKSRQAPALVSTTSSTSSSATLYDESSDGRPSISQKPGTPEPLGAQNRTRILRWPGNKTNKEQTFSSPSSFDNQKGKGRLDHVFQQLSVLRFTRCDHCGDKMWGSQLRCSSCNISVHPRCVNHVHAHCAHGTHNREETVSPPPSMFGRDLIEQVRADANGGDRKVPVIVEKCIDAVETLAMDYEGIYRKTGGTTQSKIITQHFERGDYDAFDLRNTDIFNDISSVTSVLKNYFRALPNPLLTYALHESFVAAAGIRDPARKGAALGELVSQLPHEHYHTLCSLMLHLHRVQLQSDQNFMNARNLGVVFGPTLMRSQDVGREFIDMAGKALSIEWLVENAPAVFSNFPPQQ